MMNNGLKAALDAPRCGARTRKGTACVKAAVNGAARCRNHGGGKNAEGRGSGAPKGNKNAVKHGVYAVAAVQERANVRRFIKMGKQVVKAMAGRERGD